jgi:hypothetical protein
MLDAQISYFDNYLEIVRKAQSREEATRLITALYPNYGEANFFLKYSLINHIHDNRQ